MTDYPRMAKDAAKRRAELQGDLARAKKSVAACEKEIAVLDQILSALKGSGSGIARRGRPAKGGRGKKRRKGGKWKAGKPGRPPEWWRKKQRALKAAKKPGRKKRRGRKPGRRTAPKAAPSAPASPPAPAM